MKKKRKFRPRPFISYSLLFTFTVAAVSGIILYLRPEGSLAEWTGWSLAGLDKKGWEGLHTLFTFLFVPLVLVHLYLNWRVLLNYLKTRYSEGLKFRKEIAASVLLVAALLLMALFRVPPLWKIAEWRSDIKKSEIWYDVPPPGPDFHKRTLVQVAEHLGTSAERLIKILKEAGIKVESPEQELEQIAADNNTTPENIYQTLRAGARP